MTVRPFPERRRQPRPGQSSPWEATWRGVTVVCGSKWVARLAYLRLIFRSSIPAASSGPFAVLKATTNPHHPLPAHPLPGGAAGGEERLNLTLEGGCA